MTDKAKYYVRPRIKKFLWCKPKIVYDLVMKYRYWDDPSYGNGGGDWSDACIKVATFTTEEEANEFKAIMSKNIEEGE